MGDYVVYNDWIGQVCTILVSLFHELIPAIDCRGIFQLTFG